MKINRHAYQENKTYHLEEEIDFKNEKFSFPLKSINSCLVKADVTDYGDFLRIVVNVKASVTGICSYSLEDVNLNLNIDDEIDISDQEDQQEDFFFEENPIFLLDPYILGLIVSEIPTKIVKKGKSLPKSGNGYRVLSEDDLAKEEANKTDPRWAKLDDIEL